MDEPSEFDPLSEPKPLAVALVLAILYFLVIYGFTLVTDRPGDSTLLLTFAFLFGAPAAAAAVAVRICDPRGEGREGAHATLGSLISVLILVGGVIFFGEGGVCIVMAAPIFIPAAIVAAIVTGKICRRRHGRFYATALPLLPLLFLQMEQQASLPVSVERVSDSVVIDATPAATWAQLLEVRDIRPEELGWTFTQDVAGVPKPADARLNVRRVGGVRQVRWGGGIAFGEEITRLEEGRHLAWRFRFKSDSIPAYVERHVRVDAGYLSVDEGSYRLEPLAGGRTRLTLTTRYRLATGMNAYAAWWGEIMIGDFHANVLKVIKGRAERGSAVQDNS